LVELAGEECEALHGLIHRLERRWNLLPIPDRRFHHAYDPLPFWHFLAGVQAAARLVRGRRFLDVGCGIGSKLALMHHLGWTAAGIDRHRPYIDAAAELVPEASLAHGDAFDIPHFDTDLVYMYRPMISDEQEDALETHILAHVDPGTVMFWPLRHDPEVWVI
jgi:SAM-dependent methyltransferase